MELARAKDLAEQWAALLRPFSHELLIAGSIRREVPEVGDIDLVIWPKDKAAILRTVRTSCETVAGGDAIFRAVTPHEICLDIYFAHGQETELFETIPGNFGTLAVCRTGSIQFNVDLAKRAKMLGLHWNPHGGLYDASMKWVAGEREWEIFQALNLAWREPRDR